MARGPRRIVGDVSGGIAVLVALSLPFAAQSGPAGAAQPQQRSPAPPAEGHAAPAPAPAVAFTDPAAGTPVDPAPAPEPAPPAGPEPVPVPDPCLDVLAWVADAGLPLPAGVGYRCPSTQFPHQGAACWNWGPCPGSGFIAINMDRLAGSSTAYLRHVVAHEVCHILDFRTRGTTTEAAADACAAAHGAPA